MQCSNASEDTRQTLQQVLASMSWRAAFSALLRSSAERRGTARTCVDMLSLLTTPFAIWSRTSIIEAAHAPNLRLEASSGSSPCQWNRSTSC